MMGLNTCVKASLFLPEIIIKIALVNGHPFPIDLPSLFPPGQKQAATEGADISQNVTGKAKVMTAP